jgi:hypothetical protein
MEEIHAGEDDAPSPSMSYFDQRFQVSAGFESPEVSRPGTPGTPISGASTPSWSRNASAVAFAPLSANSDSNLPRTRSLLTLTRPFKNRKRASSLLGNSADQAQTAALGPRSRASSVTSPPSRSTSSTDVPRSKSRTNLFAKMLGGSRSSSRIDLQDLAEAEPYLEMPARRRPFEPRSESWSQADVPLRPGLGRHTSAPLQTLFSKEAVEQPAPTPSNLFESLLPRELQIRIFQTLYDNIASQEDAHERWSGYAGAVRQLIRLTRVSHGWAGLALDGQLWSRIDLQTLGPGGIRRDGLVKVVASAGSFLRTLDLRGMSRLDDGALSTMMAACSRPSGSSTHLLQLNLSGTSIGFVAP